ncbi:MAG: hypothetical protein A3K61_03845 [Thaumarchaeota archaeon RBG_16_49_8]|nr:MAG: hypothetical protein A3K61_03845 [Thaumarchaeota archaeon RBG_16_49_8]
MRATKCVVQTYGDDGLHDLLGECLTVTYNAVNYGQKNGVSNRKGMGTFYRSLKQTGLPSCYKVAAITRACAVLTSRMKSEKRGVETKHPQPLRPMICVLSGFFITMKGRLFIPLRRNQYFDVQLNRYVQQTLTQKKIRSLTITPDSLSFCYSEDVKLMSVKTVFGVDRNEKNLTFGNPEKVTQINLSKTVRIKQTTREIVGSFKRSDVRIRRRLARKYWRRANNRTNQMLHAATNYMVENAVANDAAFALEDLTDIKKLYRKGNGQGREYRFRLNSWPYWKARMMLGYKSAWKGISVIPLTKSETYGSSSVHSTCGEKLHNPEKGDVEHRRMLWCQTCNKWVDRDANATVNLSQRGLARFASSHPTPKSRSQQADFKAEEKGLANEAMVQEPGTPVILKVDASKLTLRHFPKS